MDKLFQAIKTSRLTASVNSGQVFRFVFLRRCFGDNDSRHRNRSSVPYFRRGSWKLEISSACPCCHWFSFWAGDLDRGGLLFDCLVANRICRVFSVSFQTAFAVWIADLWQLSRHSSELSNFCHRAYVNRGICAAKVEVYTGSRNAKGLKIFGDY